MWQRQVVGGATHSADHDTVGPVVWPQQAGCCPQLASPSDRTYTPAALPSSSECLKCTKWQLSDKQGVSSHCHTAIAKNTNKSSMNGWPCPSKAEQAPYPNCLPLHQGVHFIFLSALTQLIISPASKLSWSPPFFFFTPLIVSLASTFSCFSNSYTIAYILYSLFHNRLSPSH